MIEKTPGLSHKRTSDLDPLMINCKNKSLATVLLWLPKQEELKFSDLQQQLIRVSKEL